MAATIDTFSDFLKPSKVAKTFSLKKSIEDVLTIMAAKLKSKKIEVADNVDDSLFVYGYPKEFNQALLNIISNALDAFDESAENRCVLINGVCEGDQIMLMIEDNAGGIDGQIIEHIFEPYISTKGDGGTGLGLYITRKIIEEHFNGSVKVENSNSGARFIIELWSAKLND